MKAWLAKKADTASWEICTLNSNKKKGKLRMETFGVTFEFPKRIFAGVGCIDKVTK